MKYMIIPDQFVIALAATAIGFIYFHPTFISSIWGFDRRILTSDRNYRQTDIKDAMGFGDVKLMCAVGLISGFKGTIIILVLTILSSGLFFGICLL